MTGYEYDPGAATIDAMPEHIGGGVVVDGRWLLEQGVDRDGDEGAAVTDLEPPRGDASEVQYAWTAPPLEPKVVTVHRHDMEGECEHVPFGHVDGPPGAVYDILADLLGLTREKD